MRVEIRIEIMRVDSADDVRSRTIVTRKGGSTLVVSSKKT